jgi:hypothetical protein
MELQVHGKSFERIYVAMGTHIPSFHVVAFRKEWLMPTHSGKTVERSATCEIELLLIVIQKRSERRVYFRQSQIPKPYILLSRFRTCLRAKGLPTHPPKKKICGNDGQPTTLAIIIKALAT